MAAEPQSEFQQAAHQKWPNAIIHGDGKYALFCGDLNHVHLYDFYMLAMCEIARDHGNWNCKDSHRMVELTPAPPPVVITRHPADCERD
jgi:hypothetical protein